MKLQVVSYYTPTYAKEAKRLRDSCLRVGIEPYLHPMRDQGSWAENVMAKPPFILACLNIFKGLDGVFFTDADSEFVSLPDWETFADCHLSYHRFQRSDRHPVEALTGSMFFCNSPTTKRFLADWGMETAGRQKSFTPEQDSLKLVMDRWQDRISWKDLPPSMVYVFDDWKTIYPGVHPVILHHQASRTKRR